MRFMATSLSKFVDNLTEGMHEIKSRGRGCSLEHESVKNNLKKYNYLSCNKNYSEKLNEGLKKKFTNIFKFSNKDINKFIFPLRKGIYPYEYMDSWKRFDEKSLPDKKSFLQ